MLTDLCPYARSSTPPGGCGPLGAHSLCPGQRWDSRSYREPDSMSFKYEETYSHSRRTRSTLKCSTSGCVAAGLTAMLWRVTGTDLAGAHVNCHPHLHLHSFVTLAGRQQREARSAHRTDGTQGWVAISLSAICLPPCALSFQMVPVGPVWVAFDPLHHEDQGIKYDMRRGKHVLDRALKNYCWPPPCGSRRGCS